MNSPLNLWEFLSRDVAFLGGPSSPILSWLGVCGILFFFVWQVFKLRREVAWIQRGFERVCTPLVALVDERGDIEHQRFIQLPEQAVSPPVSRGSNEEQRCDRDDLKRLDREMNKEPLFQGAWAQYRMTLILEQVPWFLEPRLFSTRRAEEVMTQKVLIESRINLSFYQQIPSLITGIGLLLTFLALFIGLGKLHAEGSEIVGIQGLINGLAGKFLTSIVGLMLATIFTLLEKSMVSRLMHSHHTFLRFIDQLFPRKTTEQMLEQLTSVHHKLKSEHAASSPVHVPTRGEWGMAGITQSLNSLTSSLQTFITSQEAEQEKTRRTMEKLSDAMRDEIQTTVHELQEGIHDLTRVLTDRAQSKSLKEPVHPSRPFLWDPFPGSQPPSEETPSENAKSWPRWPRFTSHRRTG